MNLIDLFINEVDKGLKYSTQNYQTESRPYPADKIEQDSLNEFEKIEINPSLIQPVKEIKSIGTFKVILNLHPEVQSTISIKVVSEDNK